MVSILLLLVNILRSRTYKFIIFVFQLINFHYRSHFLRNVIPYFWYSHIIRTFKGLCLRSHELENSLVSSPWFSVYLWNQWFSCTWSLPFRIFHVWISSPLCLRSSRLVILTSFNFSSYEPPEKKKCEGPPPWIYRVLVFFLFLKWCFICNVQLVNNTFNVAFSI